MLYKSRSIVDTMDAHRQNKYSTTSFKICTDTIQDDAGANQVFTDNKHILVNYTDIKSFPIGVVKVDEIIVVCTGKCMLPWLSREGKCTMIDTVGPRNFRTSYGLAIQTRTQTTWSRFPRLSYICMFSPCNLSLSRS